MTGTIGHVTIGGHHEPDFGASRVSTRPIDNFDDDLTIGAAPVVPVDDFDDDLTIGATSTAPVDDFDDDLTIGATSADPVDDFDDDMTVGARPAVVNIGCEPVPASQASRPLVDMRKDAPGHAAEWRPPTRISSAPAPKTQSTQTRRRWPILLALVAVIAAAALTYFLIVDSDQDGSAPEEAVTRYVSR